MPGMTQQLRGGSHSSASRSLVQDTPCLQRDPSGSSLSLHLKACSLSKTRQVMHPCLHSVCKDILKEHLSYHGGSFKCEHVIINEPTAVVNAQKLLRP